MSGTWTNWLTFELDPDYSPDAVTGLLSPISYKRCYAEFYIGKIPCIRIGGPPPQRGVVLKWFYSRALILYRRRRFINHLLTYLLTSPSRRNTFVGGTCACALPSALLIMRLFLNWAQCLVQPGVDSGFSRISQPEFIYNNAVTPNLLFAIFVARFNVRVEHLIFSI